MRTAAGVSVGIGPRLSLPLSWRLLDGVFSLDMGRTVAGLRPNPSIDAMSDEQWRRSMAINLDSVFGLVKHGVAQMKKQKSGGNVVLISSTAGQRGEAFHTDYAASKGAIISMTKGLATELARDNIRVNCVAPGWVYTDMSAPALDDPGAHGAPVVIMHAPS